MDRSQRVIAAGEGLWPERDGKMNHDLRSITLWRENPFLTTTATQLGRGLNYGGYTEIQG
jgi:hypothetical protein